jgi:hypothetical protein
VRASYRPRASRRAARKDEGYRIAPDAARVHGEDANLENGRGGARLERVQ